MTTSKTALSAGMILMLMILMSSQTTSEESPDVGFRDDFTGTSLRPEWVVNHEDPDKWALADDDYLLIVTSTWSKETGVINSLDLNKDLPENYDISVKMIATLNNVPYKGFNLMFLDIARDAENWVSLSVLGNGHVEFNKSYKGEISKLERSVGDTAGDVFLKVAKRGAEYEGMYSFDGSTWQTVGRQFYINLNGKPGFGAFNTSDDVADTGVRVDYFELIGR